MLDKEYMKTTVKFWWDEYAKYNKKRENPYLPETTANVYYKLAQTAKETAETWENVFYGYGYDTIHLENGEIEIVEMGVINYD